MVDWVVCVVLWFFWFVKGWLLRVFGGFLFGLFIVWGVQDGVWNKGVGWFVVGLVCVVFVFIVEFFV